MPSREHEIPLRIVQNQPALAPVLLKEALGFEVPHHTEAVLTSSVLTNCDPKEWNSDGAVLLRRDGQDVLAVVIERQTGRDGEKRYSWPAYLATLYGRLKCPAVLVVLCPTDSVAQWCAEPIGTGHPGFVLRPLAIGPSGTPMVTDPARARQLPELAVLSAYSHGNTEPRTLWAVVEALDATSAEHRTFYYDYVLAGLGEAARKELEGLMSVDTYEWQSDFARKYVGIGREEGREEGRESIAESVIAVLDARGFTVSDEVHRRIHSCTDLETLKKWVPKAVTVTHPEDLFA